MKFFLIAYEYLTKNLIINLNLIINTIVSLHVRGGQIMPKVVGKVETQDVENGSITKEKIDFGTAAGQVSADDIPYVNGSSVLVSEDTQAAIDEVSDILTPASATEPSNPFEGKLWLDTSVSPNSLKIYKGTVWVEEQKFDAISGEVIYDGGTF